MNSNFCQIINNETLTREELKGFMELNNLEEVPFNKIDSFSKSIEPLILKGKLEELTEDELFQIEIFKAEMGSLKAVKVINDDLRREKVYLRKKGEDVIEKALSHKYYKREPKAGGGYKYYYTKEQYEKVKGKSGEEVKKEVGSIVEHNGKKFKKQPNGKWLEVSEYGMTKTDHKKEVKNKLNYQNKAGAQIHEFQASKLSDKEHSDEEVGLSKKEEEFKIGDKVKLEDGFDKQGKPIIREYTISKPGSRRSGEHLKEGEYYLTSPGTIGFDVTKKWLTENKISDFKIV